MSVLFLNDSRRSKYLHLKDAIVEFSASRKLLAKGIFAAFVCLFAAPFFFFIKQTLVRVILLNY